ncbi:MAG: anticodon nuclease [Clostridia bacterium]|nr:anticodon nuclease [Clostridia bacterium]
MNDVYDTIETVAEGIKTNLINKEDKKSITLLYAFSSTGKTRISRILSDEENNDNICFNSFITDLFVWDNENFVINIPKDCWIVKFINEQGIENQIKDNFRELVTSKVEPRFELNEGKIKFDIPTGDNNVETGIKISKGEESLFIWSVFYTILTIVIEELNMSKDNRSTDVFNNLQYVIIDDPISSIDDSKIVTMALQLIEAINSSKSNLKFFITTHLALFYNVIYSNYRKSKDFNSIVLTKKDNQFYLTNQSKDTPFGYHLTLKQEIERAIENDDIRKYHYNLFRNLIEKTSNFLGYKEWTNCIAGNRKTEFIKKINLYSHSRLIDWEYKQLPEEDKELFKEVYNSFKKEYKWEE